MANLYYVKSERYSGEDTLAIVARTADEAIRKYRIEKKARWDAWAREDPVNSKAALEAGEGPDTSVGSVILECEIDVS